MVQLNAVGQLIKHGRRTSKSFIQELELGLGLEMVWIPAGTFLMGALPDETGHSPDEEPQHSVTIDSLWMGKFLVTQAQWEAIANLPQISLELEKSPAYFKGADHPVEQISWFEAIEFCARLTVKTNQLYRLPSEAEWEYACRAGTLTPFHFGTLLSSKVATCNDSATRGKTQRLWQHTTPVGSFGIANAFGLYDMHGNVYEWCADHWHVNYYGAPVNGSAWITDGDATRRVIRGGSWNHVPANCRAAFRAPDDPEDGHDDLGFRLVCSELKEEL